MPKVFYIGLISQVAVLFIPGAATALWFSRSARRQTRSPEIRRRPPIAMLAAVVLAIGYISLYLQFRLSLFTIAAYHALDVPEPRVHWLSWFFWGSYAIPLVWMLSVATTLTESQLRRRRWLIALYVSAPLITALVHFLLWQLYLWSL